MRMSLEKLPQECGLLPHDTEKDRPIGGEQILRAPTLFRLGHGEHHDSVLPAIVAWRDGVGGAARLDRAGGRIG